MKILGVNEAQILLLPNQIDSCIERLSSIINLKVSSLENICDDMRKKNNNYFFFFSHHQDEQTLPLNYDISFQSNIRMNISIVPSKNFGSSNNNNNNIE